MRVKMKCEKCNRESSVLYLNKYMCDNHWLKESAKRLGTTTKIKKETLFDF